MLIIVIMMMMMLEAFFLSLKEIREQWRFKLCPLFILRRRKWEEEEEEKEEEDGRRRAEKEEDKPTARKRVIKKTLSLGNKKEIQKNITRRKKGNKNISRE